MSRDGVAFPTLLLITKCGVRMSPLGSLLRRHFFLQKHYHMRNTSCQGRTWKRLLPRKSAFPYLADSFMIVIGSPMPPVGG